MTIHDPRGIQPIRKDYDADGRLISRTDGFGKQITYIHDISSRAETVTDRLDNPTRFEYDESGKARSNRISSLPVTFAKPYNLKMLLRSYRKFGKAVQYE